MSNEPNAETGRGFSGPMFEGAVSGPWTSVHRKDGGHYNTFACLSQDGMAALRDFFPDAKANAMNFVLFSTSGVHGSYCTIEEVEESRADGVAEDDRIEEVTFQIVQPRLCTIRYGNCIPQTPDDFAFLKTLRDSSWTAVAKIGAR